MTKYGVIVEEEWLKASQLRTNLVLDEYIVMPNHFHGIILVHDDGRDTARRAPTVEQFGQPVAQSLPTVVRSFKSAVTRQINIVRNTPGKPLWQRNYYEHIIRNENELNKIREYIMYNPLQWQFDRENPAHILDKAHDNQWGHFEEWIYGKTR